MFTSVSTILLIYDKTAVYIMGILILDFGASYNYFLICI